tara:strand:- start:861 stop:1262 length:402 start_codon:yes stop_codon:yes gene_type:complete
MSQQRVNIQFSIDIEELPNEIERLVSKFGDELEETSTIYSELSEDVISIAGLDEISKLRISLARADHILDDISKITNGYIQLKTQNNSPTVESEPMNPFTPNSDTLNGLEEKLKAFTNRVVDEQSSEVSNNEQ